ncbi:Nucleoplasmin-like domain-containing protein [Phytophthora infestans]|uniref:Nucleoplasmin-like domain-containing protein n=1 Tax=Phytophthora infestans TaxID=4787 RepID=A0A833TLS1_PHYIN|nr:Nucleoplasmin-like domain-containing protein [Phytophthora infestans]
MVAFWGCEVTETKAAVVDVPEGFVLNVVNATCGASSVDAQVALGLETQQLDGKVWKDAVAHLGAKQPLQVKLDLVFGHKVKFYLAKGSGIVNLSGYFQPGPLVDLLEEEETSMPSEAPKKSKKRAREEKKEAQKSWDEGSGGVYGGGSVGEESQVLDYDTCQEEDKKPKQAETPATTASNSVTPTGTAQKKKRKKSKQKKQAVNGSAN